MKGQIVGPESHQFTGNSTVTQLFTVELFPSLSDIFHLICSYLFTVFMLLVAIRLSALICYTDHRHFQFYLDRLFMQWIYILGADLYYLALLDPVRTNEQS